VAGVEVRTLTDGGQPAEQTAHALADFCGAAQQTLEIAVYDFQLPQALNDIVCGALTDAQKRGVAVRLAYNLDHAKEAPVPPPPETNPNAVEEMPFPTAAIPGVPDLMHHKYVVRDAASVWTGSTNWTADSWTREENVILTVDSPAIAARYREDFEQLWTTREVDRSGKVDTSPVDGMRAWFCPGRGDKLAHRIAKAIGSARRRVRIASPVISSAPILGTLAEVASDGKVDLAGVVDATQIAEVLE
jgi:phosphatidylserine/phosphatidylglycerophosphate/cardiolipin synthase-like enzyme